MATEALSNKCKANCLLCSDRAPGIAKIGNEFEFHCLRFGSSRKPVLSGCSIVSGERLYLTMIEG